jgi:hypothetical protein
VTRLALQSRCRGLRESNSSRLEELPPLVGSFLPVFGVASSMRLIHLLGCILEKKNIVVGRHPLDIENTLLATPRVGWFSQLSSFVSSLRLYV